MSNHFPFSKYHKDALAKTEVFIGLKFDIGRKEMYSEAQNKATLEARYVAYFVLSRIYHFESTTIGGIFNKSHNSVLNGIKKIESWGWTEEIRRQFANQYPSTGSQQVIPTISTIGTANNRDIPDLSPGRDR